MVELIIALATKYPLVIAVLAVMGALRSINKPLFAFLHSVVLATPTKADDEILEQVETSRAYKALVFVLDWAASVKIEKPVVVTPAPAKENV